MDFSQIITENETKDERVCDEVVISLFHLFISFRFESRAVVAGKFYVFTVFVDMLLLWLLDWIYPRKVKLIFFMGIGGKHSTYLHN